MGAPRKKAYKRSWKNLLINKRYQLRFTLFMVIFTAALMTVLGVFVIREARTATTVSKNAVDGRICPDVPALLPSMGATPVIPEGNGDDDGDDDSDAVDAPADKAGDQPAPEAGDKPAPEAGDKPAPEAGDKPAGDAKQVDSEPSAAGDAADPSAGQAPDAEQPPRRRITIDIGDMTLASEVPPEFVDAVITRENCRAERIGQLKELEVGYQRILMVVFGAGFLLMLGLALYGIKMTHRVAGPLYKVSLYLDKMRDNRYDRVYDLRKGDHLVEFYEQFKAAHAGLKSMQEKDVEHLRDIIEAAETDELGSRSPELKAVLDELREMLQRKEKSLE